MGVRASLSITHRCNLACQYCYSGRSDKPDMSVATARKAVDFLLGLPRSAGVLKFGFFGGEPLLRLDLMREVTPYVRETAARVERPVDLSITTNGLLLDGPTLDFLEREDFSVCLSLDGPRDVHDVNRRYPDGRGSFGEVREGLCLAVGRLRHVQVNAVYGPDTVGRLADTVRFIVGLGAHGTHLSPNITAQWTDDSLTELWGAFEAIADFYIECYRAGQALALNVIDSKVIALLKHGLSSEDRCRMGECEWGVAPSGNLYPCERLVGEDDDATLCLGNVHTGLDLGRQSALVSRRGNHSVPCTTCNLRPYCHNTCGCTNSRMTGRTDLASVALCASERASIYAARRALLALQDDSLFLDHFMGYLRAGCDASPAVR